MSSLTLIKSRLIREYAEKYYNENKRTTTNSAYAELDWYLKYYNQILNPNLQVMSGKEENRRINSLLEDEIMACDCVIYGDNYQIPINCWCDHCMGDINDFWKFTDISMDDKND
jgi:hypothetical protein